MSLDKIKISKSICTFCQTPIKNENEEYFCPSCSSPYHKDCWEENKGCAVYGCGEKVRDRSEETVIREAIINIEFLINRNQYSEAIYEAKQFLKIERRNPDFKNLYNKAVSLINNKMNLMTSGDEAFNKKDYKSAEIYYKNVLKYTDEVETNFINTRLEICKEKIPEQDRRRIYHNILIFVIIFAILAAIGYLGYYTFVLKEDRDFAELLKSDNAKDLNSTEKMISKYENYINVHSNSKNKQKVTERIVKYSLKIANEYYKDDWKLALKYYNKISADINTDEKKNLWNKIYNTAYSDFTLKNSNAKKLNVIGKYGEALNELNNALLISTSFPESGMTKERDVLESNIQLLSKKLASVIKASDIEKEIKEKDKQLSYLSSSGKNKSEIIAARIYKTIDPDIFVGKETATGNYVAFKIPGESYSAGDIINRECIYKEKITLTLDRVRKDVSLYQPVSEDSNFNSDEITQSEKEAIIERLKILKEQKEKIDELLGMKLL
ncbi:MAG: hypothetical protein HGGPFJEG_03118 [Ignavibacteria bacterium]|nr:hypothetical protein [Ignavibacteria bacterium]